MKPISMLLALICASTAAASIACAQAETRTQTVEELISIALEKSPEARQIETKIVLEKAEGTRLKTLENPNLDAEVRIPTSYRDSRGSDEVAVSISQPLRLSSFGLRDQVNELIQSTADYDKKLALLGLTQSIRLHFAKVWALEKRLSDLQNTQKRSAELEKLVEQGAASGLYGAGEAQLFKAERYKVLNEKLGIEADVARARAELGRVVGVNVDAPLQEPALIEPPELEKLKNPSGFLPAVERVQLASRLASEQSKLARLDAYPKFAPRIVYERTGDYTDYYGVGISFDLPFFDRNQAEQQRRVVESNSASTLLGYFEGEGYRSEAKALRNALVVSVAQARNVQREILPALRQALAAQQQLLRSGQGSVFQVWQTLKELVESEGDAVEQFIKAHSNRVEFVILTGQEF